MTMLQPDLNQEINFGRFAAKEGLITTDTLLSVLKEYKVERDKGGVMRLARREDDLSLIQAGLAIGRPCYISPEQAKDDRYQTPQELIDDIKSIQSGKKIRRQLCYLL